MDPRSRKTADKENHKRRSHEACKIPANNVARPSSRNPLATVDDRAQNVHANSRKPADKDLPRNTNVGSDERVACAVHSRHIKESQSKNAEAENVPRITAQPAVNSENVIVRPARKLTLEKKIEKRRNDVARLHKSCLYDADYLWDNYRYMLKAEKFYVILKSRLIERIEGDRRTRTVNWLISVHQRLKLSETSWFLTVRIMDWIISSSNFNKRYSLAGIASLWIASKMHDSKSVLISTLCETCIGIHTKQDIVAMEKEILRYIKFNLSCPDPTTFLFYYLNSQKLENDEKTRLSAMFLLETFTLSYEFSSTIPSLLAASALYLALVKNGLKPDRFLKFVTSHLVCEDRFKHYSAKMKIIAKKVLNDESMRQQVVAKYSNIKTLYVAQNFISG